MDQACPAVLARLQRGPANTLELQAAINTTHVAKPIYDLRQAGWTITTRRLPNRVALYTLEPVSPLRSGQHGDGGEKTTGAEDHLAAPSKAPKFGDVQLIREMRR